ncbi:MAG TPA: thymidine kinase [Thermotogota bacterium]|nr:thymidine kinase [Thermotogota bacterium]HQQ66093.1 thymidine kinase [Thermotogota bacterium]
MAQGKITVIVGPMYSGKTTELLSYAEIYKLGKKRYRIFKPIIDNRYRLEEIRSHSGMKEAAIPITQSAEAERFITDEKAVFFDEVQFFDRELAETVKKMRHLGKDVICAGLDMSFKENPFETTALLLCLADEVIKKRAVCHECGEYNGVISYKYVNNDAEIDVGGFEKYYAVCLDCYQKLTRP